MFPSGSAGPDGVERAKTGPEEAVQMKNRDVASVLMGLTVAWNMYGFATNFFNRAWREAPVPVVPISYALNAAIALFSPLVRSGRRWSALVATVLGVLMAAWSAIGVLFMSDMEAEMAPGVPAVAGPGVAAILGVLVAVFGRRAHED
jgi:hypothetical protein